MIAPPSTRTVTGPLDVCSPSSPGSSAAIVVSSSTTVLTSSGCEVVASSGLDNERKRARANATTGWLRLLTSGTHFFTVKMAALRVSLPVKRKGKAVRAQCGYTMTLWQGRSLLGCDVRESSTSSAEVRKRTRKRASSRSVANPI